jgi:hypothetical protein
LSCGHASKAPPTSGPASTATAAAPECRPCGDAGGNAVFLPFEGVMIPIACYVPDPTCGPQGAPPSCKVATSVETCGLAPQVSLRDAGGRVTPATHESIRFCRRGDRGKPRDTLTKEISGYRVKGSLPALAQLTASAPLTLATASARTASPTASDVERIEHLGLANPKVRQGVTFDFDGDKVADRAFVVEVPDAADPDPALNQWKLVLVPAAGPPTELAFDTRKILAVSDVDADGAEELIVTELDDSINGASFAVRGKHVGLDAIAYCDTVPLDAEEM